MTDLRTAAQEVPGFPPVLLFHQGTVAEGADFFSERWPEARAVSDPDHVFYAAFEVQRGGLSQMFGLDALRNGAVALSQGYMQGKAVGDVWTMPGFFLVQGRMLLWRYGVDNAGDQPDFAEVARLSADLALD